LIQPLSKKKLVVATILSGIAGPEQHLTGWELHQLGAGE
jgi:hypothetical protein